MTISTENITKTEKCVVDETKFGKFHKNYLSCAYHIGFDDVEIIYKDPKTLKDVQDRILNCIGYEIVDQGSNFCNIKSISNVSYSEFDQILRKVFLLLITMGKNILGNIKRNQLSYLNETKVLEITNNKLTDFCKRVLNKKGYKEPRYTAVIYTIVNDLEKIGDYYRDICVYLQNKNIKISKELIMLFEEVNDYFEIYYQLFYKWDDKNMEIINTKCEIISEKIIKQMEKENPKESIVLHYLLNIVLEVYEMALPYVEMKL